MLIYVLRHGITQWNKLKKVQGAMDIPLHLKELNWRKEQEKH